MRAHLKRLTEINLLAPRRSPGVGVEDTRHGLRNHSMSVTFSGLDVNGLGYATHELDDALWDALLDPGSTLCRDL